MKVMARKLVVGLIGGMGSGKSRVAAEFARRGAQVITADHLGHEALQRPEIRDQAVERWGRGILNDEGAIDRRALGRIVFADPAERKALEALSFPWIERRFHEEIAAAEANQKVVLIVLDAAILLEAGWDARCDKLVYVHAPRRVRLERLATQRGWNAKEVEARETAQLSLTDKVTRADAAVDNSGSLEQTARQVENLLRQWGIAGRE
jgi:dephospho-CoA kinase